ncbi:MAG: CHAD domain-containing protein [Deltaproteobacteria bacterium]|nr:CHAD domain-containing protein [Deltaproteobacteria bacterium]MCW5804691.1 CHAD domain-containing protein [Deltaproteobacteria bacterium]
MATREAAKQEPMPYPEHDKLGPLGMRPSALHDPIELRAKLLTEFANAVQAAREAVAVVDEDTTRAVHGARKALRRARGVLALLGGALPKSERHAVKAALQAARRSLSTIRDHAVAPEALGQLELSDEDRATARRVLDNAAESIPPVTEVKQLLAEAATRAAAQAEALQAAVPPAVSWDVVSRGICKVYGQARDARKAAKRSKSAFHEWRRRSKELVYQLDLVARHAGARALAIDAEFDAVTDALGPAVDLLMLREFVHTHAHGIPADEIDHLRDSLDDQLGELMKGTRRISRDVYDAKPKKFERRLNKSVKRDLTPADELRNGQNV